MALTKVKLIADDAITSAMIDSTSTGVAFADLTVDTSTLVVDAVNNRVGIGTTSPVSKLHVVGEARVYTGSSLGYWGVDAGNSYVYLGTNTSNYGLSFQTSGLERMRIDSSGNLGLGSTSVVTAGGLYKGMQIKAGNGASLVLSNTLHNNYIYTGGTTGEFSIQASEEFRVRTANTERMRIDSSGNVGIGTTSITNYGLNYTNLDVSGSNGAYLTLIGTTNTVKVDIAAETNAGYVGTKTAHPFIFRTNDAERMRIDSSGRTSIIGVFESPTSEGILNLKQSSGVGSLGMGFYDGGTNPHFWLQSRSYSNYSTTYNLALQPTGGNVGIGTDSPNAKLQVGINQNSNATGISFAAGASVGNLIARTTTHHNWLPFTDGTNYYSADNHIFRNAAHSTEWMRVNSSGNVGIGTTSPSKKLDVAGDFKLDGISGGHFENYAYGTQLNISELTTGGWARANRIVTSDSGGDVFYGVYGANTTLTYAYWNIGDGSNNTTNYSNGNGIILTRAGSVGIGTTSPGTKLDVYDSSASVNIIRARNATQQIALGVNNASGGAFLFVNSNHALRFGANGSEKARILPTGGITFNGDTSTANALDDYEEGTFSTNPVSTNVSNYSWSGANGRYTKIGRQVIVTFFISNITAGTGNRYFVLSNFPFVQHTAAHDETGYCNNYPEGQRRSGIVINNSGGNNDQWYVSWYNNSAQSTDTIRATVIYTTT